MLDKAQTEAYEAAVASVTALRPPWNLPASTTSAANRRVLDVGGGYAPSAKAILGAYHT